MSATTRRLSATPALLAGLLVGLMAAALSLLLIAPGPAQAHDELTGSDPADGSTVTAPEQLTLTYSGEIAEVGAQVAITGPAEIADGVPRAEGQDLIQDLVDDVPPGDYEVVWRVTSSDGHPISGALSFTVEGDTATEDDAAGGSEDEEATDDDAATEETDAAAGGSEDEDATEDAAAEETTSEDDVVDDAAGTDEAVGGDSAEPVDGDSAQDGPPVWTWFAVGAAVLAIAGSAVMVLRRR